DSGRLVDGRARLQLVLAEALILEDRPALEHVDELEVERVGMARRVGVMAGLGADHVRADLAVRQLVEPERAVLEERSQAVRPERVRPQMIDDAELQRLVLLGFLGRGKQVRHGFLRCLWRCRSSYYSAERSGQVTRTFRASIGRLSKFIHRL